jgi:hypothetical protein
VVLVAIADGEGPSVGEGSRELPVVGWMLALTKESRLERDIVP